MRYLIDIGHPAHVHYFKNFTKLAISKGDDVLFTCRDAEVTISLIEYYGFSYVNFGRKFKSIPGKIFGLFYFTLRLFIVSLKFRPNMYLNATMYSAIVAWILRKPHICLEDTFNKEQVNLYLPFTSCVLTGDYLHPSLGKKEIKYCGYQELLYLHPNTFIPDPEIYNELGIDKDTPYVILRFGSWNASHDFGQRGLSIDQKINLVNKLNTIIKVFISPEGQLPEKFEKFKLPIEPWRLHDALAFASLYVGEGATMASECAMLGTPSIYVNTLNVPYVEEQENKYNLIHSFRNGNKVLALAQVLIEQNTKFEFIDKRNEMLLDKLNVNDFLVWFIEKWPESFQIMKETPDYQYNFR